MKGLMHITDRDGIVVTHHAITRFRERFPHAVSLREEHIRQLIVATARTSYPFGGQQGSDLLLENSEVGGVVLAVQKTWTPRGRRVWVVKTVLTPEQARNNLQAVMQRHPSKRRRIKKRRISHTALHRKKGTV